MAGGKPEFRGSAQVTFLFFEKEVFLSVPISQLFPLSGTTMSATTATPAPDADGVLSEKLAAASLPTDGANGANGAENGDDSGDEGDDGEAAVDEGGAATGGAKKKKKKKSGAAKKKAKAKNSPQAQSEPPRVGLTKIFTNGVFPVGEIQEYTGE